MMVKKKFHVLVRCCILTRLFLVLIFFQVSMEHDSNEIFVHFSPTRCWEMVLERVNQEINKQHKLGKTKLPPLQPPGSLDGLEMFGFSSPAIVQV